MGVKFKDITTPEPITMEHLKGKILTVDASNLIYKFLTTMRQADGTPLKDSEGNITSHLSGIFFQTTTLISKQVKPIYVFDGKAPELKSKTQQERIEVKKESEKKYQEAIESGDLETARKYASRTVHLNREIIESSKKLLELMGLPYVQAKTEGEAQASYMVSQNDAWAVVSQDYDCLQFGATRMLKNFKLSASSKNMEIISLQKTLDDLQLTRQQMVDVAMLVGTDFNDGVYGIGPKKGIKLIQKYGTLEVALEKLDKTIEVDPNEIREIFLNPDVITDYNIKFTAPKKDRLIDFLCGDHDFGEERTIAAIDKLKKETGQTSLNQWF
ncbi:MAG: flap endonuclease-1 [Methanosphaera sp. rholeuAM6]|nr:MAG: flap endonuclease-1 [Methanosphaera sp. rholeuAM6]